MRSAMLPLTTRLVRAWTRIYTHGLPPGEQRARRAEIESDLWESEHDPDAPRGACAAARTLARLVIGIPDDLAWRIDAGVRARRAPVRAIAAAGVMTSPRRVSSFGLAATIHIVALSAATWVASQSPAFSPEVALGRAGAGTRAALNAAFWDPDVSLLRQRVEYRRIGTVSETSVRRAAPAPTTSPLAAVRAAAVALAERVGLVSASPAPARPAAPVKGVAPSKTDLVTQTTAQGLAARWKAGASAILSAVGIAVPTHMGAIGAPRVTAQAPSASPDRFVAKLLQNRYSLSVQNGQLSGTGAQPLQTAIAQSRFVLLGENHGAIETPEFGAALCNAAGGVRFQTMAIEESPRAATQLEGWARRPDGAAQFAAFEKTAPEWALEIYHLPKEFDMLQACARAAQNDFHLWGLNHESWGAPAAILARILETRLGDSARAAMQQLRQKNTDAERKAKQSGDIRNLFMMSADDQELARGTAILEREGNPEARSLFAELVEGREFNKRPPVDYDNARRRERRMKTLFAAAYTKAASTAAAPPRVFLKFGAYHIYRGLSPVRGSGIGNYVAEFAEAQGAQSLHIRLMPVPASGPMNEPGARGLDAVLNNRLPSGWTMFDLRPLRHDFNALVGGANPDLTTAVFGLDILVLVPAGAAMIH